MLTLLFYAGDVLYTIKCDRVREIAPLVTLKEVPHSPDYFAGYFNYRGIVVPVIDIRQLIENKACRKKISTRIIIVEYDKEQESSNLLGIMAEQVTETVRRDEDDFTPPGIQSETARFLGGIVMDEGKMIQYIELDMLPDCVKYLPRKKNGYIDAADNN